MRLILLILLFPSLVLAQSYIQNHNFIQIPNIIVTAGATSTLVAASDDFQVLTGTTTQNVVLPDATGLQLGRLFTIQNASTGTVTVKYHDASAALSLPGSSTGTFKLYANGTSNGTWAIVGASTSDVTIGAFGSTPNANGLSLVGQALNLQPADATHSGGLSTADWNTFNNKQAALTIGNLTDAGTDGIVVGSGTGAVIGSGTSLAQHVADTTHNGYLTSTDWNTFNGKGAGSVTSVGLSVPATSLFGVSGSPVTTSGTLGLTTTGTSGGIPYFSSTSQLASSALLTANQVLLGGGAGAAPTALAAGTQYQALVMGASNPGYGALDLGQSASHTGVLGISNGGTNSASVTTAPAASSWAGWDANKNMSATAFIPAYTTTATASGTTTLTNASNYYSGWTGTSNQTVVLPVATTMANGQGFYITNASTGSVTVTTSGSNTIQAMGPNTTLNVWVVNTAGGTGTASWNWTYGLLSNTNKVMTNPMTSGGDIIYGANDGSGTPARLAHGSAGMWLQSNAASAPLWSFIAQTDLPATSVQSGTATQMNIVYGVATTACTSGTCTLSRNVGLTNITHTATGKYTVNFAATYAAVGPCFAFCQDNTNDMFSTPYTSPSTTAYVFECVNQGSTNVDAFFQVACFGSK